MRNDVHFAALKAAAKVAFSVALLNGCSSTDLLGDSSEDADGDEAASTESAYAAKSGGYDKNATGSNKGLGKKPCPPPADASPAKPTCEQLLASTFPTPGDYQWEPVPQSKEVVACCDAELGKTGADSLYRWDCCVAYDPVVSDGGANAFPSGSNHFMACTPWGPPVPPSMTRTARRRNAALTAWIAKAHADAMRAVA